MNRDPLVSVVIIFLDEAAFLADAIESVLAQTHGDWQLLLVDDGSSDRSTGIARNYAARHAGRIQYLDHEAHANRGMSASRNLGLAHARGKYLAFLDADDVWLPTKLEEQLLIAERYPEVALVYGRTLIWHSWAEEVGTDADFFYDLGVTPDRVLQPPLLALLLIENKAQSPTTCNALMRRDAVLQTGGFEESFTGMFEDQVLFLKLLLRFPGYVASSCWAKYRQRPDSCSAGEERSGRVRQAYLQYLDWAVRRIALDAPDELGLSAALVRKRREVRWPRLHAAISWLGNLAVSVRGVARCSSGRRERMKD
jgi:glycosyltransferase involved in cell wall biosynthesis